jgi:putative transposase
MPRSPRADEAGGLYHALNRGNLRAEIFKKQDDYFAFEKILAEALAIHQVQLFGYLLMPNHYHLVLRPLVDGEMSRFMGWVSGTHTMRYHAHYHTSGMGHVYQRAPEPFESRLWRSEVRQKLPYDLCGYRPGLDAGGI